MRHTGIAVLGDVPWGAHFCQFYQDKQDLIDILVPYFAAGLANNEFCMWITAEPLVAAEAQAALAQAVPNLAAYLRAGQIEILDYDRWYTVGGKFDSDRVLHAWIAKLEDARKRGFDGLRLTGNTFWLEKSDWRDFTAYEAAVDSVIGQFPMLAICTYSLAKCGAAEIMDVVANHAFALIQRGGKWQIVESAERKRIEGSLREREEQFERLNRTLRAHARSMQALMRAADEPAYLREVCDIIVRDCGYAMVWVGYCQNDEARSILPVAYAGFEDGYLDTLHLTWADTERGRGPTGTALRTGEVCICRNMQTDPRFAPWREEAGKRRYNSSIVLPLRGGEGVFGALTIYSSQPDPFSENQVRLLTDLSRDFAHGINVLRLREAHNAAQLALKQSEEHYRSLFRNMAEGFALHEIVTDQDGKPCDYTFLDVNPGFEKMTGLRADAVIGRTVREVLPAIEKRWIEIYGQVALTGEPACFENHASALGRWYEVLAYRHAPRQFAVIFLDITARKLAEKRLHEAQKLESIGLLAGGIAHDFNNLLVGVVGSASLAQGLLPPDNPAAELLKGICATGEQLANLTKQLLAYSGQGRFLTEPLDLSQAIAQAWPSVQPSIPDKIGLRLELESGLPAVEADKSQLQQVLANLILNAAEAIGAQPGSIAVSTGCRQLGERDATGLSPGRYVYLEVQDTGCGMDEATKARVFDPFFSTKFIGRGLGLAAVAGIARGHNGGIAVTSSPGQGACFTVLFPVSAQVLEDAPATAPATGAAGNPTILVVDDEELVRRVAQKSLERHGYEVLLADSGAAAIDVLKEHSGEIQLIILDLSMPEMGGDKVLPELRKLRPDVIVTVSSGYSERETMRLFTGQRVAGFLPKPFTANRLVETVDSLLGK